jgi:MSHA biogenesis protein MshI
MKLHWPWSRRRSADRLAVAPVGDALAYAHADATGRLLRCGVAGRGADAPADWARRLRALGLPTREVCGVLPLADAQLLQVEAPPVRPEEMKAAARWKIKDLIQGRVEDLTIDVMQVGDERPRAARHLFVAAAPSATIRQLVEQARGAGLELSVVDIAETAQRNVQDALSRAEGLGDRATAALVRHGGQCLLTITAGSELFYTRRLDWEDQAVAAQPAAAQAALADADLGSVDFIDYGAEPDESAAGSDDTPRLVIELQRSFDLWERSWPDLPLALLWLQLGEDSERLAAQYEAHLGLRVQVMDAERVFPGLAAAAGTPEVQAQVLPLVGALLRREVRQL